MSDLRDWLDAHALGEHYDVLAENEIDVDILPELGDADLKELGLSLGARKRLLRAIRASEGAASAPTTEPPASARRQVTVLFVDLSGFTALSSERDPEEVHALLQRYFEVADETVRAYGGSVDKHIGDAVMAVFGAPVAHSDDPERAVRTAVEIHSRLQAFDPPLDAHIGIASGQVLAGRTGSAAFDEYTVTGGSVNLAARLQDMAGPGETLISGAVADALGRSARAQKVGDVSVKGFGEPVGVWRVEGIAEATDQPGEAGTFVGRGRERRQLDAVLQECRSTRSGHLVLLRGEPGIGKSRLLDRFRRDAEASGIACHTALILDFSAGKGRDAIPALVRSLLGILPGSGKAVRREAAGKARADGLVEMSDSLFLNDLLDLPPTGEEQARIANMDAVARAEGAKAAVARLVRAVGLRAPILLRVEDVHWADRVLLDRLAAIAEAIVDCPVVMVMTSRIEGDPLDATWRSRTARCPLTTIDLGPLASAEAEAFARSYFDGDEALARACMERAAGNPLFLEQLLSNAREGSADGVPASVQSIVQARFDRLEAADRMAVQAAAVLGQRFSPEAVAFMIERDGYDCAPLLARQLARPEGDGLLFSHALVRDGVYGTLPTGEKQRLHGRAAAFFEQSDPVLRARHLEAAGAEDAPGAYLAAARAERDAFHDTEALALADAALRLEPPRATRLAALQVKAELLRRLADSAGSIACYEEALSLAEGPGEEVACRLGIAGGLRILDRFEEAFAQLNSAESLVRERPDPASEAEIAFMRGNLCFPLGRTEECLAQHSRALEYARTAGAERLVIQALGGLGDANYALGRIRTARERFGECVAEARAAGQTLIEVANAPMLGWTALLSGAYRDSLPILREALEASRAVGNDRASIIVENGLSMAALDQGDLPRARQHSEEIVRLSDRLSSERFRSYGLNMLAQTALAQGERGEAEGLVAQALAAAAGSAIGFCGPWIHATAARLAGAEAAALQHLAEGEALLRQGAVAHNHYFFRREALAVCRRFDNRSELRRHIGAFRDYLGDETTAWTGFFIANAALLLEPEGDARDRGTEALRDYVDREGLSPSLIDVRLLQN